MSPIDRLWLFFITPHRPVFRQRLLEALGSGPPVSTGRDR
jgi:hypothetical protein